MSDNSLETIIDNDIKGLETIRDFFAFGLPSQDELFASYKSILANSIDTIKGLSEALNSAKNVAERYANILSEQGVNDVTVLYAVKKNNKYLLQYQNKKAKWCYSVEYAWTSYDKEMVENFAKITNGKLIEVTITERNL